MIKKIEVEVRGPLSRKEYQDLQKVLLVEGELLSEKKRMLIDYSVFIPKQGIRNRDLDIRLRITNDESEVVIKKGAWKASDSREEVVVKLQKGEFGNMVKAYAALGYKKGVIAKNEYKIYKYKDIEFKLVYVPEFEYFFEAEIGCQENEDTKNAREVIGQICNELNLKYYSDEEWFDFIERQNKAVNKVFDFDKDGIGKF